MSDFRLEMLEQKVTVMQKEVSEVLGEMQVTIQAMAATYSAALKVVLERLTELERIKAETPTSRSDDAGKEL